MEKTTDKVNQRVGTQEGRHAAQHKLLGFFKRYEWGFDQLKMAASKTFCGLFKEQWCANLFLKRTPHKPGLDLTLKEKRKSLLLAFLSSNFCGIFFFLMFSPTWGHMPCWYLIKVLMSLLVLVAVNGKPFVGRHGHKELWVEKKKFTRVKFWIWRCLGHTLINVFISIFPFMNLQEWYVVKTSISESV